MKVILIKELKGKGKAGDIIDVNPNYAMNVLIKQGIAKEANKFLKIIEDVLGFDFNSAIIKEEKASGGLEDDLLNLIGNVRDKLRANKNFELSDFIRDELSKLDVNIKDKKI